MISPRLGLALLVAGHLVVAVAAAEAWQEVGEASSERVAAPKRALGIDDYERWRQITAPSISDDGAWVIFGYRRASTFDPGIELYVRSLVDDSEYHFAEASEARFSDDSRWVAFFVDLASDEAEKLRVAGQPRSRQVRLIELATGVERAWQKAESFQFSSGSAFLAVHKAGGGSGSDNDGADLILHDLRTGTELLIGNVAELAFDHRVPTGRLAFAVDTADRTGNGVHLIDLATGVIRSLDTDAMLYSRLSWHDDGDAMAVLKGARRPGMAERSNILLAFVDIESEAPRRHELNPDSTTTFPTGMVVSDRAELSWSADGGRVFLGIKDQERVPDRPEHPDRIANVDVWHWQDPRIQSEQIQYAEADRQFTYRAAFDLDSGRIVRLTDASMRSIALTPDGRWGIGADRRGYVLDWKEEQADYYRVDTATGERRLILEAQKSELVLLPDSKSFLYWHGGDFWLHGIETGATSNLSAQQPRSLINLDAEHGGTRPPYGISGWAADGSAMVVRHRYDLWLQPLDGSPPTNLTGIGAEREIRFRHVSAAANTATIDLSQPLLLSAYGQWTKKAGFFELQDGRLRQLVYEDRLYGSPLKARDADRYLYTTETFVDFPNLHVSDGEFGEPIRVSDANPWQSEYRWGKRLLFDFTNDDGLRLQGTLAVPDDYLPGERRPMLVQFYEKNSQNLHRHVPPIYQYSWNWLLMEAVSKGYLLMQPDIQIKVGSPHADMLACVEAATRAVIEMGYADPDRIGLLGSSYSGQGAAYIAAKSDMFAAVAAGAAATDLTGDFNRFWGWTPTNLNGPGFSGQYYDILGQGRLGTNPFDDPDLYRREAPITYAPTFDTPLLMMHGGSDTNVGVMGMLQLYNAMRFNGNNIIGLLYPGEFHGLSNVANRRDLTIRTQEFFDHYLRDAPAPKWMTEGVPFLEKEHGAWERKQRP